MNLAFNNLRITPKLPSPHRLHSTTRKPPPTLRISAATNPPARDRVIDFGKHKGRILGTLPSTYLKWVSKNLRARDFEEWAKLADEVLTDPVYNDRIEWEFAEKLLTGNSVKEPSDGGAVSELLEISERFGWDNMDKGGWGKIDFGLLGTSKGGRIPRVTGEKGNGVVKGSLEKKKKKKKKKKKSVECEEDAGRRKERRERMRLRLRQQKSGDGTSHDAVGTTTLRSRHGDGGGEQKRVEEDEGVFPVSSGASSPFPGREALLNKVLSRRKLV